MADITTNKWIAGASVAAFVVHWALAIFVVSDDIEWYAPVHLNFNIWKPPNNTDEGCGEVVCVTQPVYWELKSSMQSAKILVALFSFVSGFNHLCTFLVFYIKDESFQALQSLFWGPTQNGPNTFRSFDWGISAPLMIVVNLFLYRIPADMLALFGYALFTAMVVLAGYLFDTFLALGADAGFETVRQYIGFKAYGVTCVLYLLSWLPLFYIFPYSISNPSPSLFDGLYLNDGRSYENPNPRTPPPEVYVFIFWLFASFAAFPVVQFFKIFQLNKPNLDEATKKRLYIKYEFYFIFLSALSKLPLLLLFYGGIKGRQNTALSDESAEETTREDFDFTYISVGLMLALVLGVWEAWIYNYKIKKGSTTGQTETALKAPLVPKSHTSVL